MRDFVASLGANPNNVHDNVFNSFLNIEEAGIFIGAIFDYVESGGRYSDYFRQSLLNNKYPSLISDYPIAGKSGWTYPSAWHEMAIIYAPSPFVLAILSIHRRGSEEDFRLFGEISMMFQEFNDTWFTPANINLR